eukprot:15483598-Alexandrium_andersonii.AAC.1
MPSWTRRGAARLGQREEWEGEGQGRGYRRTMLGLRGAWCAVVLVRNRVAQPAIAVRVRGASNQRFACGS